MPFKTTVNYGDYFMIYHVIWSLIVLIGKLAFFNSCKGNLWKGLVKELV